MHYLARDVLANDRQYKFVVLICSELFSIISWRFTIRLVSVMDDNVDKGKEY